MIERKRENTFRKQPGAGEKGRFQKTLKDGEKTLQNLLNPLSPQNKTLSPASEERQLSKLKRRELLEILVDQSREIDRLRNELKEARDLLADREIKVREAGNLAEASLQIYNIFETAQKAADLYLENIQRQAGIEPENSSTSETEAEEMGSALEADAEENSLAPEADNEDHNRTPEEEASGGEASQKPTPDTEEQEAVEKENTAEVEE